MPDDPPVSQGGTERGDPLNVREGQVDRLNVTRLDVATGQVKDLQIDLLREIRDTTAESGKGDVSLNSHMESMAASMKVLVQKTTAGGAEGSPEVRGFLTDVEKVRQEAQALDEVLGSNTIEFKKWGVLFNAGVRVQLKASMRELNEQVFRTAQRMSDLGAGFSSFYQATKNLYEISQTGLMDVTAIATDFGSAMRKDQDALQNTVPLMVEMAERGNVLMGALGSNADEISAAFKANRATIVDAFGGDLLGRVPFQKQNELLSDILNLQRRAGVRGSNAEILSSRDTRTQIEVLNQIAFATGKSVEEIMKLQEPQRKTLAALELGGVISKSERTSLENVFGLLEQTMGGEGIKQQMLTFIQKGGLREGLLQAMNDPAVGTIMAQGQNRALMQEAIRLAGAGDDPTRSTDKIIELVSQMTGFDAAGRVGAARFSADAMATLEMIGDAQARQLAIEGGAAGARVGAKGVPRGPLGAKGVQDELIKSQQSIGSDITAAINHIEEWLKTNIGQGAMGLTGAIASNIIGGLATFLGVGAGTAYVGGKVATKAAEKAAAKVAAEAAAEATGKKTLAKATAKMGTKSLIKKIPIVGAIAALGFAAARMLEGDFFGAGGEILSGAAGTFPGLGTVASVGIDAGLVAHDLSREGGGAAASAAGGAPTAPTEANPFYVQFVEQTDHLVTIIGLLTTANDINAFTSSNIGNFLGITVPTPGGPAPRVRGANATVFSDLQSSGDTG